MTYVSNIANFLLARMERSAMLGPEFYTAIAEWEKREIPEGVVLAAIDEVCSRKYTSGSVPVEAIQSEVIGSFRAWLAGPRRRRVRAA